MSNEKLKEALKNIVASEKDGSKQEKAQGEAVLSDAELEGVAGAATSCPTWSVNDLPL